MDYQEATRFAAHELRAALGVTARLDHSGLKGTFREHLVLSAFKRLLPQRYSMTKGVVVNTEGRQTKELDLIITNRAEDAPFLSVDKLASHPIELVRGVLQVKSLSRPRDIRDAVENIRSFKSMISVFGKSHEITQSGLDSLRKGIVHVPYGGVLCLRPSQQNPLQTVQHFEDACDGIPLNLRPDCLMVLDGCVVIPTASEDSEEDVVIAPNAALGRVTRAFRGEDALALFIVHMTDALASYDPPRFVPLDYINESDMMLEEIRRSGS